MDDHVMKTYARAEEVFVRGEGAHLWDAEGHEFLDFLGGIAVSALGHAHPRLVAALREQVGELLHVSNLYRHPWTEKAATLLTGAADMEEVFFSNSGSEAVECALKLARKHQISSGRPERRGFVALEGSFHGRTMGALSVTASERYRAPFAPLLPGVAFVEPEDFGTLDQALARKPAALILEAIQGEAGIRALSPEFLRAARDLCDATGTVLIADEVQAGCGRTGSFLAIEAAGVKPDVVALAKPLAGGLPMGATLAAAPFAGALVPGDHGSTFGGGPLACRAACVLLEELAGGLADNVRARGAQLRTGLQELEAEFPVVLEIRGRGLMLGLHVGDSAAALQRELHELGLLTCVAGGDVVRLLPPYVITSEDVADALARLRHGLGAISSPSILSSPSTLPRSAPSGPVLH